MFQPVADMAYNVLIVKKDQPHHVYEYTMRNIRPLSESLEVRNLEDVSIIWCHSDYVCMEVVMVMIKSGTWFEHRLEYYDTIT